MKSIFKTLALLALSPALLHADTDRDDDNRNDDRDGKDRRPLKVVGLTSDQRLVCFFENSPERAFKLGTVSGLIGGDTALVGIDYRVQDGQLYGVGNAGGVYMLNTGNAAATLVNRLTAPLTGTSFGVDFNPAADRLRIIGDDGQNLRHNVNTGVTVVIQSPANSGSLAPTGKLTVDTTSSVGFDIYSTLRNGVTVKIQALASLTASNGFVRLYSINLPTGKATLRGTFKNWDKVVDIAIPPDQR